MQPLCGAVKACLYRTIRLENIGVRYRELSLTDNSLITKLNIFEIFLKFLKLNIFETKY